MSSNPSLFETVGDDICIDILLFCDCKQFLGLISTCQQLHNLNTKPNARITKYWHTNLVRVHSTVIPPNYLNCDVFLSNINYSQIYKQLSILKHVCDTNASNDYKYNAYTSLAKLTERIPRAQSNEDSKDSKDGISNNISKFGDHDSNQFYPRSRNYPRGRYPSIEAVSKLFNLEIDVDSFLDLTISGILENNLFILLDLVKYIMFKYDIDKFGESNLNGYILRIACKYNLFNATKYLLNNNLSLIKDKINININIIETALGLGYESRNTTPLKIICQQYSDSNNFLENDDDDNDKISCKNNIEIEKILIEYMENIMNIQNDDNINSTKDIDENIVEDDDDTNIDYKVEFEFTNYLRSKWQHLEMVNGEKIEKNLLNYQFNWNNKSNDYIISIFMNLMEQYTCTNTSNKRYLKNILKLYINHPKINILCFNKDGISALDIACFWNKIEIIHLLLQTKLYNYNFNKITNYINHKNFKYNTNALFSCAANKNQNAIKVLLSFNANINSGINKTGTSPLLAIVIIDSILIIKTDKDLELIQANMISCIKVLLSGYNNNNNNNKVNMLHKNKNGHSILHLICIYGLDKVLKFIYNNKINKCKLKENVFDKLIYVRDYSDEGYNPFHLACKNNNTKIIKYLINICKIDITKKLTNGLLGSQITSDDIISQFVEKMEKEQENKWNWFF